MVILIEGLDRCGKDTQIRNIQQLLIDKPMHVLHYSNFKGFNTNKEVSEYSCLVYNDMFGLLRSYCSTSHFVLNRSHIGEAVYGPMYRNYSGDYVFKLETLYNNQYEFWNQLYLITFIDTVSNIIARDDGLSHSIDPIKKQEEIDRFIDATNKSSILHKKIININGKSIEQVFEEIKGFLNV